MSLRTILITAACACIAYAGSVVISWTWGTHDNMLEAIDSILVEDTVIDTSRNYSPHCIIGICPSVSATSTSVSSVGNLETTLRLIFQRNDYTLSYNDGWNRAERDDITISYQIERNGDGTRVLWRATP